MAERMVYRPDCGCEVYRIMHSKPNLYRIQYCPLHKSAPDLYKALKETVYELDNMCLSNHAQEAYLKGRQALAKANKEE